MTTADRPEAVRALWELGVLARRRGVPLVVGAADAPGLSTLLVQRLVEAFDHVDAITTARFGTGGPSCAREHHRSMAAPAWQVRDGEAVFVRGGSGRMLVWFPEPVGPQDCYRCGLAEPFLLQHLFPQVPRIQAVQAATRRDRLTGRLPMLRSPHAEGRVGAVWVEVRGRRASGAVEHRVLASTAPQATGAAAVASGVTLGLLQGSGSVDDWSLAGWSNHVPDLLSTLPDDVHLWTYGGDTAVLPGPDAPLHAARKWRGTRENTRNPPIQSRRMT